MINHQTNFESAVKDELAKAAVSQGVDKSFVGYTLAFSFGPVQTAAGQMLMPTWILAVSLRTELLGVAPIVVPIMVPNPINPEAGTAHLPTDTDFRGAARQALEVAVQGRDALMHPERTPANAVPGEVIR
jgi:hypothetical protein